MSQWPRSAVVVLMVDGGLWPGVAWIVAAVAAARYAGLSDSASLVLPPAEPSLCSCDTELREIIQARKDLEWALSVAALLAGLAGVLVLIVAFLICTLCGHLACCTRWATRGGSPGASAMALSIEEPQVLIRFDDDPVPYHHRILIRRLREATWIVVTPGASCRWRTCPTTRCCR